METHTIIVPYQYLVYLVLSNLDKDKRTFSHLSVKLSRYNYHPDEEITSFIIEQYSRFEKELKKELKNLEFSQTHRLYPVVTDRDTRLILEICNIAQFEYSTLDELLRKNARMSITIAEKDLLTKLFFNFDEMAFTYINRYIREQDAEWRDLYSWALLGEKTIILYELNGEVGLAVKAIARSIVSDSFFKYKKALDQDTNEAIKWAKLCVDTIIKLKYSTDKLPDKLDSDTIDISDPSKIMPDLIDLSGGDKGGS